MGVKGAAVATIISQTASAAWAIAFLFGKRPVVPLKKFRICGEELKNTVKLGATGFMFKATNSVVQTVVNIVLKSWGGAASTLYIGSMTIINSIREITICPCNGIVSGAAPVMSYCYGAKLPARVSKAIYTMLWATLAVNFVFWGIMVFAPQWMFAIFTADQELIAVGARCARIYFLTFPMMTLQLTGQNVFVALNHPKYALFFSLLRKIILVAPLTLLLPYAGLGVMGAFWAEAVSQVVGSLACFITMFFKVWRPMMREASSEGDHRSP
jgi:Na+-driven multidrug efflux pump